MDAFSVLKNGISYYYFPCDSVYKNVIAYLTAFAEQQDTMFKDIWPWRKPCTPDQFVYIALRLPEHMTLSDMLKNKVQPDVYGWMQATVSTWYSRRIAYVNELSARKRTDPVTFTGIGTTLIGIMENHMRMLSVDFIKLVPLSSAVGFYQKLDYKPCLGVDGMPAQYMCKVLHKKPTISYARYLAQKRLDELMANKLEMDEIIDEIKDQLNARERQLFDIKSEIDESFLDTIIYIYQDEEGGIDNVRELLSVPNSGACPSNKEINPKSGRCVKLCKPTHTRSLETGRCVSKSPKRRKSKADKKKRSKRK